MWKYKINYAGWHEMMSWQILAESVCQQRGQNETPLSQFGLYNTEQAQGAAAARSAAPEALSASPKGVFARLPRHRVAHAALPRAIPNWVARGHRWQRGCRCEQAKVGAETRRGGGDAVWSQPALRVLRWIRGEQELN